MKGIYFGSPALTFSGGQVSISELCLYSIRRDTIIKSVVDVKRIRFNIFVAIRYVLSIREFYAYNARNVEEGM